MASSALLFLLCAAASISQLESSRVLTSQAQFRPPYNAAHRGANGEYPESSVAAFKRAIENGADIIETDIGASQDGKLICLHDTILDNVTDVASRPDFAHKKATYLDQGQNVTGFFAVDFTLREIKTLRLRQRFSFRDQTYNGLFDIPTFDEYIAVALNAGRVVGIDPEIKNPTFINKHVKWEDGKLFEDVFVETLLKHGYKGRYMSEDWLKQPVFIQTFAPTSILHIVNKTDSPKIFALGAASEPAQDTGVPYSEYFTEEYLDFIGPYLTGLSTSKHLMVPLNANGKHLPPTDFVDRAHARGLIVQTATFSNDQAQVMALDFLADPEQEFDHFARKIGADLILTDHPLTLANYMKNNVDRM